LVGVTLGERGSTFARSCAVSIAASFPAAMAWLCATPTLHAQEPKAGDYYVESSDLGFKIRVPQRSELIPPSPTDANLIAKFDPQTNKVVPVGHGKTLDLHCWLLKFDRRKPDADDKSLAKKLQHPDRDIAEWVKHNVQPGFAADGQPKELEINGIAATEYYFSEKVDGIVLKVYAVVYKLKPDVDVAFVMWGPGETPKWIKFEGPAKEMARSFRPVEVKQSAAAAPAGATLRDRTRAKLQSDILKTPGWSLSETEHYFVISNNDDKDFIEELKNRLELIHAVYETDYPPAKAQELRSLAARNKTESDKGSGSAPPKEGEEKKAPEKPDLRKLFDDGIDPAEKSRCSVVRVCKDPDVYHSYGGPPSSAGYWNSVEQELVLYDDRKVGGKSTTWAVLNHEAFHQYIFYFYGNLAPQPWYNEGTGDFYSGYEYKNKKFTLKKFIWRTETIQSAIQAMNSEKLSPVKKPHLFPLRQFVELSQAEYYGSNSLKIDPAHNYAQGWSFIYFLRTGKAGGAKNWDPKWDAILDTYLRTLATTGKTDQAVDAAFKGIDFDALQTSWADYTLH
jgi:hypothetical protein